MGGSNQFIARRDPGALQLIFYDVPGVDGLLIHRVVALVHGPQGLSATYCLGAESQQALSVSFDHSVNTGRIDRLIVADGSNNRRIKAPISKLSAQRVPVQVLQERTEISYGAFLAWGEPDTTLNLPGYLQGIPARLNAANQDTAKRIPLLVREVADQAESGSTQFIDGSGIRLIEINHYPDQALDGRCGRQCRGYVSLL